MSKHILILAFLFVFTICETSFAEDSEGEVTPSRWIVVYPSELLDASKPPREYFLRDNMDLRNLLLRGVKIKGRTLQNIDFSGSAIRDCDFSHTTFIRCNFSHAKIENVKTDDKTEFVDCEFDGVRVNFFDCSKLPKSTLVQIMEYKGVVFNPASYDNHGKIYYPNVFFPSEDPNIEQKGGRIRQLRVGYKKEQFLQRPEYKGRVFRFVELCGVYDVESSQFVYLDYAGIDLSKSLMMDCKFFYVDFKEANFEDAKMINVDLSKTKNLTAEQIKSTWNWKNNRMNWFPKATLEFFKNELGLDCSDRVTK